MYLEMALKLGLQEGINSVGELLNKITLVDIYDDATIGQIHYEFDQAQLKFDDTLEYALNQLDLKGSEHTCSSN